MSASSAPDMVLHSERLARNLKSLKGPSTFHHSPEKSVSRESQSVSGNASPQTERSPAVHGLSPQPQLSLLRLTSTVSAELEKVQPRKTVLNELLILRPTAMC